MKLARFLAVAASAALLVPGVLTSTTDQAPNVPAAGALTSPRSGKNLKVVPLIGTDGRSVGFALFARVDGDLTVTVNVDRKLTPGFHGLHVHANNNPDNGSGCNLDADSPFTAVDGHYKTPGQVHGQHDGDLPSLLIGRDGKGYLSTKTQPGLTFSDLSGLAVTIHSGPDNFNNIPLGEAPTDYTANTPAATDSTAATGNAGTRVACGVIK